MTECHELYEARSPNYLLVHRDLDKIPEPELSPIASDSETLVPHVPSILGPRDESWDLRYTTDRIHRACLVRSNWKCLDGVGERNPNAWRAQFGVSGWKQYFAEDCGYPWEKMAHVTWEQWEYWVKGGTEKTIDKVFDAAETFRKQAAAKKRVDQGQQTSEWGTPAKRWGGVGAGEEDVKKAVEEEDAAAKGAVEEDCAAKRGVEEVSGAPSVDKDTAEGATSATAEDSSSSATAEEKRVHQGQQTWGTPAKRRGGGKKRRAKKRAEEGEVDHAEKAVEEDSAAKKEEDAAAEEDSAAKKEEDAAAKGAVEEDSAAERAVEPMADKDTAEGASSATAEDSSSSATAEDSSAAAEDSSATAAAEGSSAAAEGSSATAGGFVGKGGSVPADGAGSSATNPPRRQEPPFDDEDTSGKGALAADVEGARKDASVESGEERVLNATTTEEEATESRTQGSIKAASSAEEEDTSLEEGVPVPAEGASSATAEDSSSAEDSSAAAEGSSAPGGFFGIEGGSGVVVEEVDRKDVGTNNGSSSVVEEQHTPTVPLLVGDTSGKDALAADVDSAVARKDASVESGEERVATTTEEEGTESRTQGSITASSAEDISLEEGVPVPAEDPSDKNALAADVEVARKDASVESGEDESRVLNTTEDEGTESRTPGKWEYWGSADTSSEVWSTAGEFVAKPPTPSKSIRIEDPLEFLKQKKSLFLNRFTFGEDYRPNWDGSDYWTEVGGSPPPSIPPSSIAPSPKLSAVSSPVTDSPLLLEEHHELVSGDHDAMNKALAASPQSNKIPKEESSQLLLVPTPAPAAEKSSSSWSWYNKGYYPYQDSRASTSSRDQYWSSSKWTSHNTTSWATGEKVCRKNTGCARAWETPADQFHDCSAPWEHFGFLPDDLSPLSPQLQDDLAARRATVMRTGEQWHANQGIVPFSKGNDPVVQLPGRSKKKSAPSADESSGDEDKARSPTSICKNSEKNVGRVESSAADGGESAADLPRRADSTDSVDSTEDSAIPLDNEGIFYVDARDGLRAAEKPCAFVTFLWGGSTEYLLGAIVLGKSLRLTNTKHELLCLHTDDVPEICVLRKYWKTQRIAHVPATNRLFGGYKESSRFCYVFSKLHALRLTQYRKVIVLDIDMIVQKVSLRDFYSLLGTIGCAIQGPPDPFYASLCLNGGSIFPIDWKL